MIKLKFVLNNKELSKVYVGSEELIINPVDIDGISNDNVQLPLTDGLTHLFYGSSDKFCNRISSGGNTDIIALNNGHSDESLRLGNSLSYGMITNIEPSNEETIYIKFKITGELSRMTYAALADMRLYRKCGVLLNGSDIVINDYRKEITTDEYHVLAISIKDDSAIIKLDSTRGNDSISGASLIKDPRYSCTIEWMIENPKYSGTIRLMRSVISDKIAPITIDYRLIARYNVSHSKSDMNKVIKYLNSLS